MSRIRTIKPEWVDDEALHEAGIAARVLSVALINLADDHGNGRANEKQLAARVFWAEEDPRATLAEALRRLAAAGYVELYEVRGQGYFHLVNWAKHQRVDNAGKPRVPKPEEADKPNDSDTMRDSAEIRGESPRDSASRRDLPLDHDHDHDHYQDPDPRARAREPRTAEPSGRPPPDPETVHGRWRIFEALWCESQGGTGMGGWHPGRARDVEALAHVPAEAWEAEVRAFIAQLDQGKPPLRDPFAYFAKHAGQWAARLAKRDAPQPRGLAYRDADEVLREKGLLPDPDAEQRKRARRSQRRGPSELEPMGGVELDLTGDMPL